MGWLGWCLFVHQHCTIYWLHAYVYMSVSLWHIWCKKHHTKALTDWCDGKRIKTWKNMVRRRTMQWIGKRRINERNNIIKRSGPCALCPFISGCLRIQLFVVVVFHRSYANNHYMFKIFASAATTITSSIYVVKWTTTTYNSMKVLLHAMHRSHCVLIFGFLLASDHFLKRCRAHLIWFARTLWTLR